ncbi:MAG: quinoprotein dehydrogenase-associated putative ABC transporter substrate-binding protein [Methylococcales bacterium]
MRAIVSSLFVLSILFSDISLSAGEAFKICADPNNPPFSNRIGTGFENVIGEMFAEEIGQSTEYSWFPQRIGFIRNTLKAKLPDKDEYKCDAVMGVPTGYELTITTKPYYRSTYMLVIRKDRGWDDIASPIDLTELDQERQASLRIAMFDRGPGTAFLKNYDLLEQGVPYQSMTGNPDTNTAMTMDQDLKSGKIDMAILWGPMAGYVISNSPPGSYNTLPMNSVPGIRFHFPISMGVRHGDEERKNQLDEFIDKNQAKITELMEKYNIPLVDENGRSID